MRSIQQLCDTTENSSDQTLGIYHANRDTWDRNQIEKLRCIPITDKFISKASVTAPVKSLLRMVGAERLGSHADT